MPFTSDRGTTPFDKDSEASRVDIGTIDAGPACYIALIRDATGSEPERELTLCLQPDEAIDLALAIITAARFVQAAYDQAIKH